MSQNYEVLTRLQSGRTLTAVEALREFGCFRLAARICDLRDAGFNIKTIDVNEGGKKYAKYVLKPGKYDGISA